MSQRLGVMILAIWLVAGCGAEGDAGPAEEQQDAAAASDDAEEGPSEGNADLLVANDEDDRPDSGAEADGQEELDCRLDGTDIVFAGGWSALDTTADEWGPLGMGTQALADLACEIHAGRQQGTTRLDLSIRYIELLTPISADDYTLEQFVPEGPDAIEHREVRLSSEFPDPNQDHCLYAHKLVDLVTGVDFAAGGPEAWQKELEDHGRVVVSCPPPMP